MSFRSKSGRTSVSASTQEPFNGLPSRDWRNKPLPLTPKPSKPRLRQRKRSNHSLQSKQRSANSERPISRYESQNLSPLSFSTEILEHIFGFLDNKTLSAVARTCKVLSPLAYHVLYNTVILIPPSHHTCQQRPHILKRFHGLVYALHMSDVARASLRHLSLELSTETPLRAYEFLKKTQNLDSLNVHVCPPVFGVEHDPMKESERLMTVILRCPGLRTLRTFTHTGYDSLFRNVTHLSHFLSRTPDLERLSMILPNQLGALESRSPIFPSTRALRYATIISPKFDGTLRALLAAISKSIESLELLVNHAITDPKAARSALYSLGPRLKYLSFHANIPPADYRFLDSLPFHLHGLRGLYLSRGTCTSALFENLHHAKKLRYLGLAGCLPDVVKEDKVIEFLQAIGSRSVTPVGEFECACDDGSTTQRTRSLKRRFRRLVLFPLVNQATDPPIPLDSPLFDTCRSAGVRLKLETSLPAQFSDVGQVNCRQTEPIWH